jgi:formamidopyrimidine-DNA glycosylase
MPELPEIETLRNELAIPLKGALIERVIARRAGLRWPFPAEVLALHNAPILNVSRRSKYLLLELAQGTILIHLGMSGQLRLMPSSTPPLRHDHLDLVLSGGRCLRLRDPRRFGAVLWQETGTLHSRLADLGPEPLENAFSARALLDAISTRRAPIKSVIMDSAVVVGVGNIYATEALFAAKIDPRRPANTLTTPAARRLVTAIRSSLRRGIAMGGSSMRDYVHSDGSLGGFLGTAKVYGKAGKPCPVCARALEQVRLGGRASVWCRHCQK